MSYHARACLLASVVAWLLAVHLLPAAEAVTVPATNDPDAPLQVIHLGKASYANRPPRSENQRPGVPGKAGWGDQTMTVTHMKLWVTPGDHGAIPSTDWWTNLITSKWGGQLWSYPSMLHAGPQGVTVNYPKRWVNHDKTASLVADTRLLVRGAGFRPESSEAESWSDWLVTFRMAQSEQQWMRVTMGHGLPCTWFETAGIELRIDAENAVPFDDSGADVALPRTGSHLGLELMPKPGDRSGDCYGLFAPAGTAFTREGASIALTFASGAKHWLVVAVMPKRQHLATFATYAPAVPRDTRIDWHYQPEQGRVATTWSLTTENLAGGPEHNVIQGFIPHHYNTAHGTTIDFATNDMTYATPRGELRCAIGHTFGITWPFTGLMPELPAPSVAPGLPNPYRKDVMTSLLRSYTGVTGYGGDTYWGGKSLLLYAKYMEMAYQCGEMDAYQVFRKRLTAALIDFATYTPGEDAHYFSMYPPWGSFMGFHTRDNANPGIDYLQDHAFCYGYHVYATALLGLHDPDYLRNYGGIATLMVKDYANWDRSDRRFPFFRSMDPWSGHSWSGGLGGEEGNGMESSSESMQAWGAMFVLGEVLGDQAMRDAAAFGYASESRAVAEYWFDRDKKNLPRGETWKHPYSSNTSTDGIGWWTWFSGDPFWMHSIQWLPMSPLLRYLGEDPAFARWDYETMWSSKAVGGWESNLGNEAGVGNVALSYLNLFDPDEAARIFDDLWDKGRGTAHARDESGPSYYRIHAGRALGRMRFDAWTDIPTSVVWQDAKTHANVVSVYNSTDSDRQCHVFVQGKQVATIRVPPRRIIAHRLDAAPSQITIDVPSATVPNGGGLRLSARVLDQYGVVSSAPVTWHASGNASVDASGAITGTGKGSCTVTASTGTLTATRTFRVDAPALPTSVVISPSPASVMSGSRTDFTAQCLDQYGDPMPGTSVWTASGGGTIDATGTFTANQGGGPAAITALVGTLRGTARFTVTAPPSNLALGRPATASSQAGTDHAPGLAFDGSMESRWQSRENDAEWLSVDLGAPATLVSATIRWENAYGKDFDIQASPDGAGWTTIGSVRNGAGGVDDIALTGQGRWVRFLGIKRGTTWGYSIFEFEVYGVPSVTADSGGPSLTSLNIEPPVAIISDSQTQRFAATGCDQAGHQIPVTATWRVKGSGTISPDGTYTPHGACTYEHHGFSVVAEAGGITASATIVVDESRRATAIRLSPDPGAGSALHLAIGGSVRLLAEVEDQFKARFLLPVAWSAEGAVRVDVAGRVTAAAQGSGTVTASSGAIHSSIAVMVMKPEDMNLAAGHPATASSGNPGDAVDGNPATRWESAHSDPQWIAVDLESPFVLRKAVLHWEAARAKVYRIEVSGDGTTWREVYSTQHGDGSVDTVDLGGAAGRYIRLDCDKRSTGYGNSLWELEVYGRQAK